MLANSNIGKRLAMLVVVTFVGMVAVGVIGLVNLKENLIRDRQIQEKALVESVLSIIDQYYQRARKGEFTEVQLSSRALEAIEAISYSDGGYVFVVDAQGTMLAHPTLKGKNFLEASDARGSPFSPMFLAVLKDGGGFVNYYWKRDAQKPAVAKISYIAPVNALGWVVGTGIYVDDVDAIFKNNLISLVGASVVMFLIICGGAVLIGRATETYMPPNV